MKNRTHRMIRYSTAVKMSRIWCTFMLVVFKNGLWPKRENETTHPELMRLLQKAEKSSNKIAQDAITFALTWKDQKNKKPRRRAGVGLCGD